jgi:hypothetical protein
MPAAVKDDQASESEVAKPISATAKPIDVTNPSDVREWANAFGVTSTTLKDAVKAVGNSPEKVQRYLGATLH